jgi:hypothetical protein
MSFRIAGLVTYQHQLSREPLWIARADVRRELAQAA